MFTDQKLREKEGHESMPVSLLPSSVKSFLVTVSRGFQNNKYDVFGILVCPDRGTIDPKVSIFNNGPLFLPILYG
jgi:hypothetical protein